MMKTKQDGFTLLEMAVVITMIVGVVILLNPAPMIEFYHSIRQDIQDSDRARFLVADLDNRFARASAISELRQDGFSLTINGITHELSVIKDPDNPALKLLQERINSAKNASVMASSFQDLQFNYRSQSLAQTSQASDCMLIDMRLTFLVNQRSIEFETSFRLGAADALIHTR